MGLVRSGYNLHTSGHAQCLEAGGKARQRDVEMESQCQEVLTYSKEPQEDPSEHLDMSLAEALCLGCRLQGLPGGSHMPER